jgi:hypothetical protein
MSNNVFIFLMAIACTTAFTQYNENQSINIKRSELPIAAEDLFQKLDYKLYPNPLVGNLLNFISPRSEIKEIAILNILGKEVLRTITLNNQILLPNLVRGIYIVKLKQGNYLGLSRLVVP